MDKKYLNNYTMAMHENRYSRIVITACILIIFILLCAVLSKDKIVVIQPYTQSQEVWVSDKKGSQEYKEAWALLFAQELGNVTPDTLEFLKQRLGAMISPRIYTEFMETLGIQAEQIKDDRITLRFVPRSVEYEPETDKVFVSGFLYTRSVGAMSEKETREVRTYEFIIKVNHYAPVLERMDTYKDVPRTLKKLRQIEAKEKRQNKNKK